MGDDPFGRNDEGAEVVDHVARHGTTPSIKSGLDSRASVRSSKALSTKTIIGDEASVKEPLAK
jgi:hypothetical protein